ncbi:pantetheine-phosphate adenylyltransferase [Fastidiosibacter lacustris]|uniref:pantetheine-phosphate adenylyltransferase n=1 Tax=Fastidiosibacter lacustris TaxID=2056695 RepID=UPI000E34F696|nr:pantetheine-phosphate adenylyltransferase [Fastidiosibacter lacustris]
MIKVVYPGTFDPISLGHIDLIKRAKALFGEVIVAISTGDGKKTLFSKEERLEITRKVLAEMEGVQVVYLEGLIADFVKHVNAKAVIRGLRVVSDFDYEFQMANINRHLNPKFETIFLTPDEKYTCLSSTMIRQVSKIDPYRVAGYVHSVVLEALLTKQQVGLSD